MPPPSPNPKPNGLAYAKSGFYAPAIPKPPGIVPIPVSPLIGLTKINQSNKY